MKKYIVAGLTGQSGAGKTTVSNTFKSKDFAVINCDEIARVVTKQGSDCNRELSKLFPECFDDNFALDRQELAKIVFTDRKSLDLLNKTIFPYITRDIKNEIEHLASLGNKYILLDAPTLFEAGADSLCDIIISCVADKNIRAKRIALRDNISQKLIKNRFDSQKTEQFFIEHSDFIIENNKDKNFAVMQCEEIIEKIKRRFNG
ncbi:MAG: dephospho-CoA kinase [Ruminococcus sp.]|nr:dephospho-CoA kinase [Ruminococcus sp.]